jgi:putative iron-dependent peroxidase
MFVGKPPGNYDRLLDFSTAVTGTLFFVPSATFLDGIPDAPGVAPGASNDANAQDNTPRASDGSLGIGSLKMENTHE